MREKEREREKFYKLTVTGSRLFEGSPLFSKSHKLSPVFPHQNPQSIPAKHKQTHTHTFSFVYQSISCNTTGQGCSPVVAVSSDIEFPLSPGSPPLLTPHSETPPLHLPVTMSPGLTWQDSTKHLSPPHHPILTRQELLPAHLTH